MPSPRIRKLLLFASSGLIYLLRDDFNTDQSAPLPASRVCEPGPGTLTIVDTNNIISVSSGSLVINGTPAVSDSWRTSSFARSAGLAMFLRILTRTAFASNPRAGWGALASSPVLGTTLTSATVFSFLLVGTTVDSVTLGAGIWDFAWVLRSTGIFLFARVGSGSWKLYWAEPVDTTTPLYAKERHPTAAASNYSEDFVRVMNLSAPFDSDYGLATQRLAGTRSGGDTFTHEANCLIEYIVTTLPAAGTDDINFRAQDASNYWQVSISTLGTIILYEVVAGVPTARATVATVVSNGHRVVIIADSTTIRVYSNNVLRATYSSASNFATATSGSLASLGTGGSISDIVSWPRTLSGAAAALLDAAVA